MNVQDSQEESYSMYPKTSSPPPMPHVNMRFPMYQNPVPMYQTPYMYAQPSYNFKMMNQNQMGYQGNMPQQNNPVSKKKWNSSSNGVNMNATVSGMNPAKSQPYYPNQSQSFYGQSASNNNSNKITRSSSVSYDPFKFDVSKLDVAKVSESCKKFPLFINTTATEFAEARAKAVQIRSSALTSKDVVVESESLTTEEANKEQQQEEQEQKKIVQDQETQHNEVQEELKADNELKKREKESENKKREKEARHRKDEEPKKITYVASTTSVSSVASDDTTATSSPISTSSSSATLTAGAPPAPKSWSAIASSAVSKGKPVAMTKTPSPLTQSTSAPRQKKDKNYIPPSTKGAEPIGSIALRTCFDPDYVNYILKKDGVDGDKDLPIKSIIPRGIINRANICFMSSVLQVLLYCKPFIDILNVLSTRNSNSRLSSSSTKLLDACISFYTNFDKETFEKEKLSSPPSAGTKKDSKEGTPQSHIQDVEYDSGSDAIKPDDFYRSLSTIDKFKDLQWGHQEDAEEFLTHLLDQLHEELIAAINCLTENEIHNILQSINDEDLKAYLVRNLVRYKDSQFMKNATSQLTSLLDKYGSADDNDDENGWHEISGSSKKGKKNKTAAKRTVEVIPSPISDLFGGQFRSVLDIPNNKESQSITLDPFQTIQLDISDPGVNDLETAFKKFSEYELIPFKSSNGNDVEAKKQTFIDKLPGVLLIQLKRFSFINNTDKDNSMTNYNAYSGRIEKIRKKINYDYELTIPAESVSSPMLKQNEANRHYELTGVIYHHGLSSDGGHYTADVYHRGDKKWYRIDDVAITELKKDDVLKVGNNGSDPRTAYILIYEKL